MEPQQPNHNVPPIVVNCPFCNERLTFMPNQAGAAVSCPKCGGNFQVPMPTARDASAPYGAGQGVYQGMNADPEYRDFVSKKIAAGILGILLGGLGIHKFVLGFNTAGTIMLCIWLVSMVTGMCIVVPLLGTFAIQVIGLIEGVIYLTKSDEEFYQTYYIEKKDWF